MRRVEINRWNRAFSPKVIERIRKKIAGGIKSSRTVLVDFENVKGITPDVFRQITEGWDKSKVKIIACGRDK